jgi:hypothetical protein
MTKIIDRISIKAARASAAAVAALTATLGGLGLEVLEAGRHGPYYDQLPVH